MLDQIWSSSGQPNDNSVNVIWVHKMLQPVVCSLVTFTKEGTVNKIKE